MHVKLSPKVYRDKDGNITSLQAVLEVNDGENTATVYLDYPDEFVKLDEQILDVDDQLFIYAKTVKDGK